MQQEQPGPLPVSWMLSVERRITRVQDQIRVLGSRTTAPKDERRRWEPRDYMMAGAGMAMVIAALSEKTGWTSVIVGLSKLYGGR
jgi:hypothetical protein